MTKGTRYLVLESSGGDVEAITGGWQLPDPGEWALAQVRKRSDQMEGRHGGSYEVLAMSGDDLSVWMCGDGSMLHDAYPDATWTTFCRERTIGRMSYEYPGEWYWEEGTK